MGYLTKADLLELLEQYPDHYTIVIRSDTDYIYGYIKSVKLAKSYENTIYIDFGL